MTTPWYQRSLAELDADAAAGDAHATLRLADAYEHGLRGATADEARAHALLALAAERGSGVAACRLGDRANRVGDLDAARAAWRRAAELGSADAMSNLAWSLRDAAGDERAEGHRWLVRAAEAGQPFARNALAQLVATGDVPRASLAELARTPLEELAAAADDDVDPLEVSYDDVEVDAATLDHLVGRWIDRLERIWPDVLVRTEVDGAVVDFPGGALPDGVFTDEETVTVTIKSGLHHVDATFFVSDAGALSLWLASFAPRPAPPTAAAVLAALDEVAAVLDVALRRSA